MTIYPISYSSYSNVLSAKNNPQAPEAQIAFRGNMTKVGKTIASNATAKTMTKVGILAGFAAFITGIPAKIKANKAQKEIEAKKAEIIKELSEKTYKMPELFGTYPNEYPGYADYYCFSKSACEAIAEFYDKPAIRYRLENLLNREYNNEKYRGLSKEQIIELGKSFETELLSFETELLNI